MQQTQLRHAVELRNSSWRSTAATAWSLTDDGHPITPLTGQEVAGQLIINGLLTLAGCIAVLAFASLMRMLFRALIATGTIAGILSLSLMRATLHFAAVPASDAYAFNDAMLFGSRQLLFSGVTIGAAAWFGGLVLIHRLMMPARRNPEAPLGLAGGADGGRASR